MPPLRGQDCGAVQTASRMTIGQAGFISFIYRFNRVLKTKEDALRRILFHRAIRREKARPTERLCKPRELRASSLSPPPSDTAPHTKT